jgi:endonuclease G
MLSFAAKPSDYADRNGYEPDFLGEDASLLVPLPGLGAHAGDCLEELKYRRFSVVVSKSRKFCRYTVVNIAGELPWVRVARKSWRRDVRAGEFQVDDEVLYGPDTFSRGHMVRRLDPLWEPEAEAKQANWDTFHYPNAVPQVQGFNDGMWGDLEDHILDQGETLGTRLSVFTGPILRPLDPVWKFGEGIQLPMEFYKVIVTTREAGGLLALAFVQSQEGHLRPELRAKYEEGFVAPFADFDPGEFATYQVKVSQVEAETGLDFGNLRDFDPLEGTPTPFGVPALKVLVATPAQIQLV